MQVNIALLTVTDTRNIDNDKSGATGLLIEVGGIKVANEGDLKAISKSTECKYVGLRIVWQPVSSRN